MHPAIIILVFLCTYVGMAAGRLPHLQIDRNGIALLGVIVLLASTTVNLDELGASIDVSTLVLLFALMIIYRRNSSPPASSNSPRIGS
jgi:Na+/H+ antiporter NhaD/arsenite permease-like protein